MMPRGPHRTVRRPVALAVPLLVAALALTACSDDEPTAAPTTAAPTTSATSLSPSDLPSVPTETATPTPAATPSAPVTATPSKTSGGGSASCPAAKVGGPNTKGMSPKGAATAKKLSTAARACDAKTLIQVAKADGTGLQGDLPADKVFASASDANFIALATLLTLPVASGVEGTVQPRVFSPEFLRDDAAWNEVIKAGLLTEKAAAQMRGRNSGYSGYRTGIGEDGTWTFFATGGR